MAQEIRSEEIVLNENEIVCLLSNKIVKVSEKENNLQYMIQMMSEEYGFPIHQMLTNWISNSYGVCAKNLTLFLIRW